KVAVLASAAYSGLGCQPMPGSVAPGSHANLCRQAQPRCRQVLAHERQQPAGDGDVRTALSDRPAHGLTDGPSGGIVLQVTLHPLAQVLFIIERYVVKLRPDTVSAEQEIA